MRPLQDLDPFKVVKQRAGLHVGRLEDAIGINRCGGRGQRLMVDRPDTANLEGNLGPVRHRSFDPGEQFGEVFGTCGPLRLLKRGFIDQQDRARDTLDKERLPRGSDHDGLVAGAELLVCPLRHGTSRDAAGNQREDGVTGGFHKKLVDGDTPGSDALAP